MYLHLGQGTVVSYRDVLAFFDLDNTSASHLIRRFSERVKQVGQVVNVAEDLPKSFVPCRPAGGEATVYPSQLSTATLLQRAENNSFEQTTQTGRRRRLLWRGRRGGPWPPGYPNGGSQISEEFENSTTQVEREYGGPEIQVLEGLEAVRKHPGMYIGPASGSGLHHPIYEIVDNFIDEALAGYCDEITVEIGEGDITTVTDNGRGIPVNIRPQAGLPTLEVVFTILHVGGKSGGGGYKMSGSLHDVGASVVNVLSGRLEVRVHKEGKVYEMKFPWDKVTQPMQVVGNTDRHDAGVVSKPDPEMLEITRYSYDTLYTCVREEAFLNAGLKIHTIDECPGREQEDTMHYVGGIREFVFSLNQSKDPAHPDVVYMVGQKDDVMAEVAFQYNDGYSESIVSFASNIHTPEGGMYEEGFKRVLTTVLNNYGKRVKILRDDDKISSENCREGIVCVISVKLTEAQPEGQTKAKLGNSEIRILVNNIVTDKFFECLEENPAAGRVILDKALMANRVQEIARKTREPIRCKTALGGTAMPDKLWDCNEVNPELTELYIVEGDPAGGSATQGRDSRFQAIFPLWDKMLNVEKVRADKVHGNDKLTPAITALGAGIGDDFDLEKLRYHKVIIMADANMDGSHIRTLLLTFFSRFMRPLIEHGYAYAVVPPLFRLSRDKTTRLTFSEEERGAISAELRGDNPSAKVDIFRLEGLGEMNPHEPWETTMDPERRTSKRIELNDTARADQTFTVLMGEKVEPRKESTERNTKYAVNLGY